MNRLQTALGLFVATFLFVPAVTFAETSTDEYLGEITEISASSYDLDATASYDVTFEVDTEVPSGTTISIFFDEAEEGGGPTEAGFSFTAETVVQQETATITSTDGLGAGNVVFEMFLTAALETGSHSFRITNVENPSSEITAVLAMTTSSLPPSGATGSEDFVIGENGGPVEGGDDGGGGGDGSGTNVVSEAALDLETNYPGVEVDYTFTFTFDSPTPEEEVLLFYMNGVEGGSIAESGFSFSDVSFESDTINGTGAAVNEDTLYGIVLANSLPAGEHAVTISGVQSASAGDYYAYVGTGGFDVADQAVRTSVFTLAASAPAVVKRSTWKIKKKKKKQARITWAAPASSYVTKYQVQVKKCKNATKKLCTKAKHFQKKKKNWRKFKNVGVQDERTRKRRNVKKLKKGTFYHYRVRACNPTGCSKYKKWKRFKTKGNAAA